jgi:hypothetical protein
MALWFNINMLSEFYVKKTSAIKCVKRGVPVQKTKRLFVVALFAVIISLSKLFLPFPFDKMFIVVQAIVLALSALLIKKLGATYVGGVSGVLTAVLRPALGLFSFLFALLYGVLVDGFFVILKVRSSTDEVSCSKSVAAMTLSSAIIGFVGYYTTVVLLEVLPMETIIAVPIVITGSISGALAGYTAAVLWNKRLKNIRI